MGEGGGGEEKALSFFRFHLSPFPQKRLILRLAARGLAICQPRASDTHAVSYQNITTQRILLEKQEDWLICHVLAFMHAFLHCLSSQNYK